MPVRASRENEDGGESLVLRVRDHLDASLHKAFREAYEGVEDVRRFIVDLRDTEHLDSSALGMLLLLREFAKDQGSEVVIRRCRYGASRTLQRVHFHQLFRIEE